MPTPEDPLAEPPISDYDFWMVGKRERLGTQLSGYARVMFLPEAKHMKETGESYSDEWFEVWDGILPPSAVVELTGRVGARLKTLPVPEKRALKATVWQYAGIARQRVV